jgi:predicted metalloendopeptidase
MTNDDAATLVGRAGLAPSLFAFDVAPDSRNPERNAAQLAQSGLTLDRDIYLDSQETEIRSALRDYAAEILAWIGWPEPSHAA